MSTRTALYRRSPVLVLAAALMTALFVFSGPLSAQSATKGQQWWYGNAQRNTWNGSSDKTSSKASVAGLTGPSQAALTVQFRINRGSVSTGSDGLVVSYARKKNPNLQCRWTAPTRLEVQPIVCQNYL